MQHIVKFFIGIILLVSAPSLAQKPLELKFELFEMLLVVNNKIVDHTDVGANCNFRYKYREKSYWFNYSHNVTKERLNLPFKFIEKKNRETYVRLHSLLDDKSIFVVKDSIYKKDKIEFINTVREEGGDVVSLIYRFSKVF